MRPVAAREGARAFEREVGDALGHLHDPARLRAHPLLRFMRGTHPDDARAGGVLRACLLEALASLGTTPAGERLHRLLARRYVEGLGAPAVQAELAVGKSEYYRQHARALAALAALLRERWDDRAGSAPAAPEGVRHNLPRALTSFVGRERELAEVGRLLRQVRLLTLTGAGGVGKTRLALEAARAAGDDHPDGVWLVDLAPLGDPALVPWAVARALGVPEQPGRPLDETLVAALRPRQPLLLVLDNCEHLIDACARLAEALLVDCPALRVLATSREPLAVGGELTWRVPSLAVPDGQPDQPAAALAGCAAVALFVERAGFVSPGFALTAANAAAVAELCRRLDGIPLALELAAARVAALSAEEIAARLDDRFRLLTGGRRTAPPRQQTLAAALDWSHDLLTGPERAMLRRLAVFAGGWTLEAAEAVCAGEGVEPAAAPELLARLVDKSLVQAEARGSATRFRLLETVRQYAGDKLLAAGEAAAVRDRHRDYCLDLAEQAMPRLQTRDQVGWFERLEAEHDNLRAALDWSHGQADGGATELRLAGALGPFWNWRGYNAEGLARLTAALAHAGAAAPPAARALALNWAGVAAGRMGDDHRDRARAWLEESRALARAAGDWRLAAHATRYLGRVASASGDQAEWRRLREDGLRLARRAGEPTELTWALGLLAYVRRSEGDEAAARPLLEEGLALAQASGERTGQTFIFMQLALQAIDGGEYGRARALLGEALVAARELSAWSAIARQLAPLGLIARLEGEYPAARAHLREALATAEGIGDRGMTARVVIDLAGLSAVAGQPRRAARLWGATVGWRASASATTESDRGHAARYEHDLAGARAALGEAAFAAAWAAGQALSLEEAVAEVLAEPSADGEPR